MAKLIPIYAQVTDVTAKLSETTALPDWVTPTAGAIYSGFSYVDITMNAELAVDGKQIDYYQWWIGSTVNKYTHATSELTYSTALPVPRTLSSVVTVGATVSARNTLCGITAYTNFNVIPYSRPYVRPVQNRDQLVAYRCDEYGNKTDSGTYLKVIASKNWYTLDTGENTCALEVNVAQAGSTNDTWYTVSAAAEDAAIGAESGGYFIYEDVDTIVEGVELGTTKFYTITFRAIDRFGEVGYGYAEVAPEGVTLKLGRGGKNVSVGRYPMINVENIDQDGAFEIAEDWLFVDDGPAQFNSNVKFAGTVELPSCPYLDNINIDTDADVMSDGCYIIGYNCTNVPFSGTTCLLEVFSSKGSTDIFHRVTSLSKSGLITKQRVNYSGSWGEWADVNAADQIVSRYTATIVGASNQEASTWYVTKYASGWCELSAKVVFSGLSGSVFNDSTATVYYKMPHRIDYPVVFTSPPIETATLVGGYSGYLGHVNSAATESQTAIYALYMSDAYSSSPTLSFEINFSVQGYIL